MKIVNRKTFLSLPAETLFSKYEPCIFGELTIKGDTVGKNDFLAQQISDAVRCHDDGDFSDILDDAQHSGSSFSIDLYCYGRDGMFDEDQLFVIWERKDVEALVERLNRLLQNAGSNGPSGVAAKVRVD